MSRKRAHGDREEVLVAPDALLSAFRHRDPLRRGRVPAALVVDAEPPQVADALAQELVEPLPAMG